MRDANPNERAKSRNRVKLAHLWVVLAVLIYGASRVYFFSAFEPKAGDTRVYVRMAMAWRVSADVGLDFYQTYVEMKSQFTNNSVSSAQLLPEYPPLAVASTLVPLPLMPPVDFLQSNVAVIKAQLELIQQTYGEFWRKLLVIVDVCTFGMVFWAVRHFYGRESGVVQAMRLLVYTASSTVLAHLVFDRLDGMLALLITVALMLLVGVRSYVPALGALALAINFKLVPVLLAPIWLIGAVSPRDLAADDPRWLRNITKHLLWRAACLGMFIVGLFLPFLWLWGRDTLAFFSYHGLRGLQAESTWSSLIMALSFLGVPFALDYEFGAWHVRSALGPVLGALSTITLAITLAAVAMAYLRETMRRAHAMRQSPSDAQPTHIAQLEPQSCFAYALLALLVALSCSKVLSPQYLIWLVPLVALFPWSNGRASVVWLVFVALCGLTTVIFPYAFVEHILGAPNPTPHPTTTGIIMLCTRNLLIVGLTIYVWRTLRQRPATMK